MNDHTLRCREALGGLTGPSVPVLETGALHRENDINLLLALEKG